jgi:hypothetical protein
MSKRSRKSRRIRAPEDRLRFGLGEDERGRNSLKDATKFYDKFLKKLWEEDFPVTKPNFEILLDVLGRFFEQIGVLNPLPKSPLDAEREKYVRQLCVCRLKLNEAAMSAELMKGANIWQPYYIAVGIPGRQYLAMTAEKWIERNTPVVKLASYAAAQAKNNRKNYRGINFDRHTAVFLNSSADNYEAIDRLMNGTKKKAENALIGLSEPESKAKTIASKP